MSIKCLIRSRHSTNENYYYQRQFTDESLARISGLPKLNFDLLAKVAGCKQL